MIRSIFILMIVTGIWAGSASVLADGERKAYVIELHHQLADNLLPTIKPMLGDGDNATAFDNELVVTTTADRIDNIRSALEQLDKPMRNLQIMVRNNNAGTNSQDSNGLSGGIHQETIRIDTGEPVPKRQPGVTVQSRGLAYTSSHTVQSFSSTTGQHVRAVEGQPAFIASGETRLLSTRDAWGNPASTPVDAQRGFYVTARLAGDRVVLDIEVRDDRFDNSSNAHRQGDMTTRHLQTTVSGAVGEWISLGGIQLQDAGSNDSQVKKITTSSASLGNISIMVTPLD